MYFAKTGSEVGKTVTAYQQDRIYLNYGILAIARHILAKYSLEFRIGPDGILDKDDTPLASG